MKMKKIVQIGIFILLVFIVVSFSACKKNDEKIIIGADNSAEETIISEMLKSLIEHYTDIEVEVIGNLGAGETVMHPAILKGDIDMYPEYTGTAWMTILGKTEIPDREKLNSELFAYYEKEFNLKWVGLYGFNNSYGLGIYKPLADEYNIKTYSDLAKNSDKFTFCAESIFFERVDGIENLTATYGFKFKKTVEVSAAELKYDIITSREADVIDIFTTDGRLEDTNLVILEDDKKYFPEYLCGTVIRMDTLNKYPELEEVLMKMNGILSDAEMSKLNYKVETLNEEPKEVAQDFLREKKLID